MARWVGASVLETSWGEQNHVEQVTTSDVMANQVVFQDSAGKP